MGLPDSGRLILFVRYRLYEVKVHFVNKLQRWRSILMAIVARREKRSIVALLDKPLKESR